MKDSEYAHPQSKRLAAELWSMGGLTKAEYVAAHALNGLLASLNHSAPVDYESVVHNAVSMAEMLLAKVNEVKKA